MDNEDFKTKCVYVDSLDIIGLKTYLASIEKSNNDPFPDDDMAGDIGLTLIENKIRSRLLHLTLKAKYEK